MKKIVYTKHAEGKLERLRRVGSKVSKNLVAETVFEPENIDFETDYPKIIASRPLDKLHILRVVFRYEDDKIIIVTLYPARKGRYYESKKN